MMTQTLNATREAAVAGAFYPANPKELHAMVQQTLTDAKEFPKKDLPKI